MEEFRKNSWISPSSDDYRKNSWKSSLESLEDFPDKLLNALSNIYLITLPKVDFFAKILGIILEGIPGNYGKVLERISEQIIEEFAT